MSAATERQMRRAVKAMDAARKALAPFEPSDADANHSVTRLREQLAEYANWLERRADAAAAAR